VFEGVQEVEEFRYVWLEKQKPISGDQENVHRAELGRARHREAEPNRQDYIVVAV